MKGREKTLKKITCAAATLLSLFAIACGGSGSDSGDEPKSAAPTAEPAGLSRDEFLATTDRVCLKFTKDLKELQAEGDAASANNDYQALGDLYDRVAIRGTEMTKEIAELGYEGEDSDLVQTFIDASKRMFAQTGRLADAMRAEDISAVTARSGDVERASGKADGLALGLGLKKCGFSEG